MRALVAMAMMALAVTGACRDKASPEAVAATCRSIMERPFWKSWEAKVAAEPAWEALDEEARATLREEAATAFEAELASPAGKAIFDSCVESYSRLSPAQLDCARRADATDQTALQACLDL